MEIFRRFFILKSQYLKIRMNAFVRSMNQKGVSSLILDYEAVRMNADGLHLSRLSNGHMESLNRITKDLKKVNGK